MQRIRICHLITTLAPGGAERAVYELATRLDRRRFEATVVGLRGGLVSEQLSAAGMPVEVLDMRGKWDLPRLVRLRGLLRRLRPDILHTHLFHADVAGRLAGPGAAHVVHTIHTAEGRFRPWQFAWARWAPRRPDRLICVSKSVRDFHARKALLPAEAYTIIPNGIDVAAFARDDSRRAELRLQWGLKDDDVLAAYVGRLHYEKGTDLLPAALGLLAARGAHVRCVIAGDGPLRPQMEDYVRRGPGGSFCRLLGYTGDVRGVLSAADVFLMPSRWEGWPLAMAEAMSAGLAIVAADVPGVRDLVAHGESALLFPRGDAAAFADDVQSVAGDSSLRARLSAAARKRAQESCGIERFLVAHEKLYDELAAT